MSHPLHSLIWWFLLMSEAKRDHLTVTHFRTRSPGTHFISKQGTPTAAWLYSISRTIWKLLTREQTRLPNTILKQRGHIPGNRLIVLLLLILLIMVLNTNFNKHLFNKTVVENVWSPSYPNTFKILVYTDSLLIWYATWKIFQTNGNISIIQLND